MNKTKVMCQYNSARKDAKEVTANELSLNEDYEHELKVERSIEPIETNEFERAL